MQIYVPVLPVVAPTDRSVGHDGVPVQSVPVNLPSGKSREMMSAYTY
jgi:hypothetical protein